MVISSLRQKLLIWAAPGIIVVGGCAALFAALAGREVARQAEARWQARVTQAQDHFLRMRGDLHYALADFAFWDEMVRFTRQPDPEWARINLSWFSEQFKQDFVVVLSRDGQVIYAADSTGRFRLGQQGSSFAPARLGLERPDSDALWEHGDTPVWLTAGTIHSTASFVPGGGSTSYSAPGEGIIIAGWTLSERFLERLSDRIGAKVQVVHNTDKSAVAAFGNSPYAAVRDLSGLDGRPVAKFYLVDESRLVEVSTGAFWGLAAFFFGALMIGLGLLALAVERGVVRPLVALRGAVSELHQRRELTTALPLDRKDEVGQLAREVATFATSLNESEFQRSKSDERYRHIVETAEEGIWITDAEGRITFGNQKLAEMFGHPLADMTNHPLTAFLDEDAQSQMGNYLKKLRQGAKEQQDFQFRREDGTELWTILSGRPFFEDEGRYIGALGMVTDITQRVNAEKSLRKSEEQLRQSQKMDAIGKLAGGVAHDFNNLLTVILGQTELLLSDLRQDDPMRRDLEGIQNAAERASSLTRQLLAFSKRQVLQPKVLDLGDVVTSLSEMLRRVIGSDITLVLSLDPALGRAKADPGQIEQVIMNLTVNARDAMAQGGTLSIETGNVEMDEYSDHGPFRIPPGRYVMLAVSDTGCGMDEETMSQVFEPFFTTKEVGRGTGLGLSTLYGIVKQSGGYVWVFSHTGHGSTFKIYLPRVDQVVESAEPEKTPTVTPRGSETILLAEDEPAVRELACRILRKRGYTVLEAQNGVEALELHKRHPGRIHLMLTDVVMPGGVGGRELAERLTRLRPEMKVLYMSGYSDRAIVDHVTLDLGTAYLQKPFTVKSMSRKVRDVLDRGGEDRGRSG